MNRISNKNFLRVAILLLFFLTASQACTAREEVPMLPMTVQGTALVDDAPAPIGTTVATYLDGDQVGKCSVSSSSGEYCFWISGTAADEGKTIRFTVNGKDTGKILTWKAGKQVLSLQLSAGKGANSDNNIKSLTSIMNSESQKKNEKQKALGRDSEAKVIESSVPVPDVDILKSMSTSSSGKETIKASEDFTILKSAPGFTAACTVAGIFVLIFGFNMVRKED